MMTQEVVASFAPCYVDDSWDGALRRVYDI